MEIKFQAGDQVIATPLYSPDWSRWARIGFNVPYPGSGSSGGGGSIKMKDGDIAEIGWDAKEFQPVKKTDISIFKKLESPIKPKVITNKREKEKV